jgi:hypothetical protein
METFPWYPGNGLRPGRYPGNFGRLHPDLNVRDDTIFDSPAVAGIEGDDVFGGTAGNDTFQRPCRQRLSARQGAQRHFARRRQRCDQLRLGTDTAVFSPASGANSLASRVP